MTGIIIGNWLDDEILYYTQHGAVSSFILLLTQVSSEQQLILHDRTRGSPPLRNQRVSTAIVTSHLSKEIKQTNQNQGGLFFFGFITNNSLST